MRPEVLNKAGLFLSLLMFDVMGPFSYNPEMTYGKCFKFR
jgi:hypothetical protein